ncbi:MAG: carboxylesterase/lipase family protein [Sphingomonadales bacterium]|nr:carboxylesterase/lipase family protein [Sphingomonadales bacterium]
MTFIDRRAFLALAATSPIAARAAAAGVGADPLVVPTGSGLVRGRSKDDVRVFTAIPYGAAARFAAPTAAPAWRGIRDATGPAAVAPQPPGFVPFAGTKSEGCLQLNIWAPALPGRYPVLFWIHGGGNETGWSGDASIAGDRFAAHGVVCVTANYRIGALGFAEMGELLGPSYAGSANNGVRDLVLALGWVRANIAAFGGDPGRVTIAGESAGGKNVATLMGVPAADRLYANAAIFSGGGQTVHTPQQAREFARLFAAKLGGVEKLRTAPVQAILAAQAAAKTAWPRNFPFRPMTGTTLLPKTPLERIAAAGCRPVPMLIGTNADESRVFLPAASAGGAFPEQNVSNESMERMAVLDAAYARAFPDLSVAERHWRLLTAEEYGMPCLRIADRHADRGAAVYRYRLTYPAPGGPFAGHSPHVLDVPFTFDHVTQPPFAGFFGLSAADQPLADAMHRAVIGFVHSRVPAAPGLPTWQRYDRTHRQTMVFSRSPALVSDPDRTERLIWEER